METKTRRCSHQSKSDVEGISGSGWYVGQQCDDCGKTLWSRHAGNELDGPH